MKRYFILFFLLYIVQPLSARDCLYDAVDVGGICIFQNTVFINTDIPIRYDYLENYMFANGLEITKGGLFIFDETSKIIFNEDSSNPRRRSITIDGTVTKENNPPFLHMYGKDHQINGEVLVKKGHFTIFGEEHWFKRSIVVQEGGKLIIESDDTHFDHIRVSSSILDFKGDSNIVSGILNLSEATEATIKGYGNSFKNIYLSGSDTKLDIQTKLITVSMDIKVIDNAILKVVSLARLNHQEEKLSLAHIRVEDATISFEGDKIDVTAGPDSAGQKWSLHLKNKGVAHLGVDYHSEQYRFLNPI